MHTIQKYLYYALFFITPFIMYSGTSELFEFNKMIFIYIITSGILCIWIAQMIRDGRIRIKRTPFDIFIGIFFASQVVSTLFSIDFHTSIFGYYGRFNGGLLSLISYLILYYSLTSYLDKEAKNARGIIHDLLRISLFSSFLVILWGLPGKVGHDLSCLVFSGKFDNTCWTAQFDPAARMFSTLGQPNWFGSYIAITFFICLYFYLRGEKNKLWYLGLILLNLIGVFFSNSRSSLLATFITSFGVGLTLLLLRKQLEIRNVFKQVIPLLIGLCLFIFLFKTGVSQIDKYLDISNYVRKASVQKSETAKIPSGAPLKITESTDIRKIVWEGALNLGKQYPLFGTGLETFAYSYYFVRPVAHNLTSEWDYLYNKAHNEYLNYLATTGFFGIGSYLLFIFVVVSISLFWIIKKPSLLQLCLLASWISILITNFVGFSTTVINIYFYLIPVFIYFLETSKNNNENNTTKKSSVLLNEQSAHSIWYVVIILVFIFLLQYFISYWVADTKFALGENFAKSNDYQTAINLITQAQTLHPEHVYKDKLSFYMASFAVYQKEPNAVSELIQKADEYNLQSLKESPQNILYWKTRIKNQYLFYQITLNNKFLYEGRKALQEAQRISPSDPKLAYFSATYYAMLFDDEKKQEIKAQYRTESLDAIERSIKLKSDYFDSYYLKAQLYKKYQMKKEAKDLYEYILKNVSPNNSQVIDDLKSL